MLRMMLAAAIGLSFLSFGIAEDKKEVPKDLLPLQGKWKVVKMTNDGIENKDELGVILEFKGDQMIDFKDGERQDSETIKVDPSKSPATMDITTKDKKFMYGIYKIEKDKLTLCFIDSDEKNRPAKFESAKDSKVALVELEKAK